jgi:hypothetical protein
MHAFYASIPRVPNGSATCAPLPTFQVFAATGADAVSFLHGQLTQDVASVSPDMARLAGYCTPKGRLLATLVFWRAAGTSTDTDAGQIYGLVRTDIMTPLLKRLSLFVLRAKVKLTLADLHVAGIQAIEPERLEATVGGPLPRTPWQRTELPSGTWITAPAAGPTLRWWWVASNEQLQQTGAALASHLTQMDATRWHMGDLAAGLPWITASTQDLFIPQTVNLDLIGGVSFTKGCYPGQEVVARSHYRGTIKRRMSYGLATGSNLPVASDLPGTDIYDATQPHEPCGRVVDAAGQGDPLALLFETTVSLTAPDLRLGAAAGPRIERQALPGVP